MKVAISDYKTGQEIWRGEIDKDTWDKYLANADKDTGACRFSSVFGQGLLTNQVPPATIFCQEVGTQQVINEEQRTAFRHLRGDINQILENAECEPHLWGPTRVWGHIEQAMRRYL